MIVKPKISNDELFNEISSSSKKSNMYTINFGPFHKPIFKMELCTVKYPLGRFDKLVVEHEHVNFISEINRKIKESLGEDSSRYVNIKDDELGIKITALTKAKVEKLQKFDVVDILVEFNNCWYMAGKIYPSFTLKDFKESDEKPVPKEVPFSFSDIED